MIKRRGRQFDLAALRERSVHRHDVSHRLPLQRQHLLLLLFREATVLLPQRRQPGIALNRCRSRTRRGCATPGDPENPGLKIAWPHDGVLPVISRPRFTSNSW